MRLIKVISLIVILIAFFFALYRFSVQNSFINPSKDVAANNTNIADSLNYSGNDKNNSDIHLDSEAAILVDTNDSKVLFSQNAHEKLYPASLTKLMTALLLSKKDSKDTVLTYDHSAKEQPSNKLSFSIGSNLTADNAMKGMLIFSANDFATMIADNISGSTSAFSQLMNSEASGLGMHDTHFVSANGLHNENHYTTVYDLSILACKVYKVKWIMDCLSMSSAHIAAQNGKGVTVFNTNQTLDKNGCFAGKTGHTEEAGYCLAAYYKKDNKVLIGIVLHAPSEKSLYSDMNTMVNKA